MKLAVTGASGFIGERLIPRLCAKGHELVLFGRDVDKLKAQYPDLPSGDYATYETMIKGCDAVLHMAVLNNDMAGNAADFHTANVELPVKLATQAAQAGVSLFVHFTTLQAIELPFASEYALSKHKAEQELIKINGIRVVHLRLAAVHADKFRGKLSMLNAWPKPLRVFSFLALAALRPTTHIDQVDATLHRLLVNSDDYLATDTQQSNWLYQIGHRLMDISFALCTILFFGWLLMLCAIAISLSSNGPIIFRQVRIGRHGIPFICYKFRTMKVGSLEAATHEVSVDSITKFGHVLRRTRLDELPQIINLLRGEMSLVGPRPCLPQQHELIAWREKLGVFSVKPGITGLAQIRGVDMSNPERLARIDAEYVARQSLLLDLKIFLTTLRGGHKDYVKA